MNIFNTNKSDENRKSLCNKRLTYKKLIRAKNHKFKVKQSREFENVRKKRPKDFWSYFRIKKKGTNSEIGIDDFQRYFSELFNEIKEVNISEVNDFFISSHDFNPDDCIFWELDRPISISEVESVIKKLKINKAVCPGDNLLNEYFIESSDIISGHLTDMLNIIFDSSIFPECWSKGYIVPLHKKGDTNQTTNYRGITLMSNLGKLFSSILTSRVESRFESNNFISDSQFGFRKKCGTTDAIFVLSNLVEHILNYNLCIPCAFIDLKRAFDSINREALWYKLFNMGCYVVRF